MVSLKGIVIKIKVVRMVKKVLFFALLISVAFSSAFGQPIASDPTQEDKKEQSEAEKKALEDMVLTAPQPSFTPVEAEPKIEIETESENESKSE